MVCGTFHGAAGGLLRPNCLAALVSTAIKVVVDQQMQDGATPTSVKAGCTDAAEPSGSVRVPQELFATCIVQLASLDAKTAS